MYTYFDRMQKSTRILFFLQKYSEFKNTYSQNFLECISGRVLSIRRFGKLYFIDILDQTSKLQIIVQKNNMNTPMYQNLKNLRVGNIISVLGYPFYTRMRQLSIKIIKLKILNINDLPMPEKWHGLKNINIRHEKRYLDLILTGKTKRTFDIREKIIKNLRKILNKNY